MSIVRYIADMHFDHESIIAYDNRPFSSVTEMNEELISRWNRVVKEGDLTWILGDFCLGSPERWAEILDRLNGRKALISGNHDSADAVRLLQDRFEDIAEYREITDGDRQVILCHYPILAFRDHYFGRIHLYGHVHTGFEANITEHAKKLVRDLYVRQDVCQSFNVGAMLPWMDYTPRSLEDILRSANSSLTD